MDQFECIDLENVESVAVVKFKDKKVMDPARIEKLGLELLTLVKSDKSANVLINFENVNFFSSAAINKLIILEKRVRACGGKIRLSNLRRKFAISSVTQILIPCLRSTNYNRNQWIHLGLVSKQGQIVQGKTVQNELIYGVHRRLR